MIKSLRDIFNNIILRVAKVSIPLFPAGKDERGWAMYIDHQRSWFLHGSTHHGRCEGGLGGVGALVGVLLEWRHQRASISFYVNYEQQVRFLHTYHTL